MLATPPVKDRPAAVGGRITGIDVARAIAMFGMVIAHYVWPDETGTWIDRVAEAVSGRAMPLFVLLGGLGVTILTARSANPDRALLIRAAILFPLGVALQEGTTFIAIILQSYAVFFLAAVGLRRVRTVPLMAAAAVVALIGTWSYQDAAFELATWTEPGQLISQPSAVLWSLLFNGHYPFFPVASFFIVGMVIGRLDLRSPVTAARLAIGGAAVGFGTLFLASFAISVFDVDRNTFDPDPAMFSFGRLLDTEGHSEMLAWVLSAGGTSMAIVGASLWLAPRLGAALRPLEALGQLALTFYVTQALLVRVTTHPRETSLEQEFVTAMVIYFVFMAFAVMWKQWFRFGPLEVLFRIGSRSRPQDSQSQLVEPPVARRVISTATSGPTRPASSAESDSAAGTDPL